MLTLKLTALVAAPLFLAGCTTQLQTEHVSKQADATVGTVYNLPMAVFNAEARFLVTRCEKTAAGNARLSYELVDGSAEHHLVPDPQETYSVRYDQLNAATKMTAATFSWHPNGMLKSINAESDDRTAQVMASAAGTALNLFKAAALGGVGLTSAGGQGDCDEVIAKPIKDRMDTLAKMPAARAADKVLGDEQDAADDIAKSLDQAKTQLAEAQKKKDAAATAKAQAAVNSLQAQWNVASAKLKGRARAVPALQEKLNALTETLTVTARKVGWAPRIGESVCMAFSASQKDFLEQLAASRQVTLKFVPSPNEKFEASICVEVPQDARNARNAVDRESGDPSNSYAGVVYRLPALGYVRVERGARKFYTTNTVSLPQFGAKGLVWLRNQPFDNNSVKASFNEDGSMSELTFKAASQAERGAAAISDASKSVVDLMQMRADAVKARASAKEEEEKKAQQKQLDSIDAQIALLNKRKDLETARAPRDVLDREKDLLQKQIEVETLRQQYDALKKKAVQP